ncbi:MAG: heavy-metal-associated domain-containing protein [Nitrososphaerota archaeon]|jgi:copper chaperone CopZ|nr:heavy-metal-associated domain-containing protein [Nitrososphaerota archaeon]MDG6931409.1 heavy-metal-associated domain-containing protein [Nitrososphaerota archaeon]MDG6936793.1 heavy-metal-associated domain-containing protein [Nitrososphaerota archaeon]MDG6943649.1 heavy-metal-associated domain-containing protein [Nitrososphaerota archaeon]
MDKTVKLRIFGMTCDGCVRTVETNLKSARGVKGASVAIGSATVMIGDEILPEDLLKLPVFGQKSHYRAQIKEVQ